jgi:cell division protein FtsL
MTNLRKNSSGSLGLQSAVKYIALFVLAAGMAVGYVWQKAQILHLGKQIKENENRLAELRRENKARRDQLDKMRSPAELEQRVKDLKLGLVPPQPAQVITLVEAPVPPPATPGKGVTVLASRGPKSR